MYHFYTENVVLLLLLLLIIIFFYVCVYVCVCGGGGNQHVFRLPKLSSLDFRSVRLAN